MKAKDNKRALEGGPGTILNALTGIITKAVRTMENLVNQEMSLGTTDVISFAVESILGTIVWFSNGG